MEAELAQICNRLLRVNEEQRNQRFIHSIFAKNSLTKQENEFLIKIFKKVANILPKTDE